MIKKTSKIHITGVFPSKKVKNAESFSVPWFQLYDEKNEMNISLNPLSYIFGCVGNGRAQLPMSGGPLAIQQAYTTVVTK